MRDPKRIDAVATRATLIAKCLNIIHATNNHARSPEPRVGLVIGKGRLPKGFPRGKVICVTQEQEKTGARSMSFPAMRVLAYALALPRDP